MNRINLIIRSGMQRGADCGAVFAAEKLGIKTAGFVPSRCRTESLTNPGQTEIHPEWILRFGLTEVSGYNYYDELKKRTVANVQAADATIIIARNMESPGTRLTIKLAAAKTPADRFFKFHWDGLHNVQFYRDGRIRDLLGILSLWGDSVRRINFAGNRESKAPGIEQFTTELVTEVLTRYLDGERADYSPTHDIMTAEI